MFVWWRRWSELGSVGIRWGSGGRSPTLDLWKSLKILGNCYLIKAFPNPHFNSDEPITRETWAIKSENVMICVKKYVALPRNSSLYESSAYSVCLICRPHLLSCASYKRILRRKAGSLSVTNALFHLKIMFFNLCTTRNSEVEKSENNVVIHCTCYGILN